MKYNQDPAAQAQGATIIATKNITLKKVAFKRQEILNIFAEFKAYKKATNASAGQPSILAPIDWTKKLLEVFNSKEDDEICTSFQQGIKKVFDTLLKNVLDSLPYNSTLATALNIKCTLEGEEYNFTLDNTVPIDKGSLPNKSDYIEYNRLNALLECVFSFEFNIFHGFKMKPYDIEKLKYALDDGLLKPIYTGLTERLHALVTKYCENNIKHSTLGDIEKNLAQLLIVQKEEKEDHKILEFYSRLKLFQKKMNGIYESVSEDKDCEDKTTLINDHYQITTQFWTFELLKLLNSKKNNPIYTSIQQKIKDLLLLDQEKNKLPLMEALNIKYKNSAFDKGDKVIYLNPKEFTSKYEFSESTKLLLEQGVNLDKSQDTEDKKISDYINKYYEFEKTEYKKLSNYIDNRKKDIQNTTFDDIDKSPTFDDIETQFSIFKNERTENFTIIDLYSLLKLYQKRIDNIYEDLEIKKQSTTWISKEYQIASKDWTNHLLEALNSKKNNPFYTSIQQMIKDLLLWDQQNENCILLQALNIQYTDGEFNKGDKVIYLHPEKFTSMYKSELYRSTERLLKEPVILDKSQDAEYKKLLECIYNCENAIKNPTFDDIDKNPTFNYIKKNLAQLLICQNERAEDLKSLKLYLQLKRYEERRNEIDYDQDCNAIAFKNYRNNLLEALNSKKHGLSTSIQQEIKEMLLLDQEENNCILLKALNIKYTDGIFTLDDKVSSDTALTSNESKTPFGKQFLLPQQDKNLSDHIKTYHVYQYQYELYGGNINKEACHEYLDTTLLERYKPLAKGIYSSNLSTICLGAPAAAICKGNSEALLKSLQGSELKPLDLREIEIAMHVMAPDDAIANIIQSSKFDSLPLPTAIKLPLHYINHSVPGDQKTLFIWFMGGEMPREKAIKDILNNENINEAILYGHGLKEMSQDDLYALLNHVKKYQLDKGCKEVVIFIEKHGTPGSPEMSNIATEFPQLGERMSVIIVNCYGSGVLKLLADNKSSLINNNLMLSLSDKTMTSRKFADNICQNFNPNDITGTIMSTDDSTLKEDKSIPMVLGNLYGTIFSNPTKLTAALRQIQKNSVNNAKSGTTVVTQPKNIQGKLEYERCLILDEPEEMLDDIIKPGFLDEILKNRFISQEHCSMIKKHFIPLVREEDISSKLSNLPKIYDNTALMHGIINDMVNECICLGEAKHVVEI